MFLFLIMVLIFILFFLIFSTLFGSIYRSKYIINIRLNKLASETKYVENELNQPLFTRFIRPILDDITKTILKITPKEIINNYERKIITAGNPYNRTVKEWINLQVIILICVPAMTIMLCTFRKVGINVLILIILIECLLGLLLPNIILKTKITDRQKKITSSMPDVLDLLSVSVEAGLAFDGAIAKVIEKTKGPIADEFGNVLKEMKIGKNKKDALRDMAERVNIQDLTSFVGSVIQADQLGVSIGNVLKIQSKQMREKRRQRVQEKAMKAPIKMLIPMVLFIFPTIFSVLLGPAVIKVINVFAK